MAFSFPWSRCALALAIGSLALCAVAQADAAGYGRAPRARQVAMTQDMMASEYEMPTPPQGPVYADDAQGYDGVYGNCNGGCQGCNGGCQEYNGGPGGCCSTDGYYSGDCGGGYCDGGCGGYCDGGCDGGCGAACDCYPPMCSQPTCVTPRCAVWAEHLYLQATDIDVVHAQQQDGLDPPGSGGAGTVPFGEIGSVGMKYDHGVRLGAAIGCGCDSSVLASWTFFETDSFDRTVPPTAVGGGLGAVGSFVHHPGAAILASLGPLDATYEIEFHLGDVLYNRVLFAGNRYCIGLLAGAQYGHLEQRFAQVGEFAGGTGGVINTSTSIDFDGGGLKAGLDGEGQVSRNVSVYGRVTGAAMSGRFRSRYTMLNTTGDVLLAQVNWSDDRIVPHLEYELGVACTMCNDCVRISSGYMFSHWFNTITTSELIDAVRADNYVDVGDTLSFDGFVSRVEVRW